MKKCFVLFLSFCILVVFSVPAFAADSISRKDLPKYEIKGVQWQSESDTKITPKAAVGYWKCANLSSTAVNERFVDYVSSPWAYADKYTIAEAKTITFGIQPSATADLSSAIKAQVVVVASYAFSKTTTISIPADPTRKNRLGLFSDFVQKYVKSEYYSPPNYTVTKTLYNYVYDPVRGSSTLKVVYY
ncbi:hypothetical protein [Desulfosporosinus shakirovi]|uniref:hypothetical protein n=1 Tax=Desulfosporosinus shakirovi TaxID=2885154 RepID=UPI001E5CCFD9|nr:hypothetical protein [Desulfosporosinus sp. SRJS8]MCB8817579.1 hypothetical protein [Desulfosporosinus sp. SRJS8]